MSTDRTLAKYLTNRFPLGLSPAAPSADEIHWMNRALAMAHEIIAAPEAGWCLAKTAPDDGTPVLVCRSTTGGPETLVAYTTDEHREEWHEYWDGERVDFVTHWRLLPETPPREAVWIALNGIPGNPDCPALRNGGADHSCGPNCTCF